MFDLDDKDQPELLPVRFPSRDEHPHTLIVRYFRTQTSPGSLLHVRFRLHPSSKAQVDLLWRNHVAAAKAVFEQETGLRPPQGFEGLSDALAAVSLEDEGKETAFASDEEKESESAAPSGYQMSGALLRSSSDAPRVT